MMIFLSSYLDKRKEHNNTLDSLIIVMVKHIITDKIMVNIINMDNLISKGANSLTKTNKVIMDIKTNKTKILKETMQIKGIIIRIKDTLNTINMVI